MSVKNEIPVQKLQENLPSFYKDYIYSDRFIKVLFDSYVEIANTLNKYTQSINYNTAVSTAELYRTIDTAVLVLSNSLYDVHSISNKFRAKYSKDWFDPSTPMKDKVEFLDSLGFYEVLDTHMEWNSAGGEVISLDIAKDFSLDLGYYVSTIDYVVSNNRLYLFGELAKPTLGNVKKVLLKNININSRKLENRWGLFFDDITAEYISRYEYKDFLEALVKYKPTINDVKNVASALRFTPSSDIRDMYTRKNVSEEELRTTFTEMDAFNFVYRVQEEYNEVLYYIPPVYPAGLESYYKYLENKTNNVITFLDLMKPSYTNFFLRGVFTIPELEEYEELVRFHVDRSFYDSMTYSAGAMYGFPKYGEEYYANQADMVAFKSSLLFSDDWFNANVVRYSGGYYGETYFSYEVGDKPFLKLNMGPIEELGNVFTDTNISMSAKTPTKDRWINGSYFGTISYGDDHYFQESDEDHLDKVTLRLI